MRKYDELRSTTSNKVHRRLRIPETACGWCGLGAGCNKRRKRSRYEYNINQETGNMKAKFPSWKIMSKYKKQYQKPRLQYKQILPHSQSNYWFKKNELFEIWW